MNSWSFCSQRFGILESKRIDRFKIGVIKLNELTLLAGGFEHANRDANANFQVFSLTISPVYIGLRCPFIDHYSSL